MPGVLLYTGPRGGGAGLLPLPPPRPDDVEAAVCLTRGMKGWERAGTGYEKAGIGCEKAAETG